MKITPDGTNHSLRIFKVGDEDYYRLTGQRSGGILIEGPNGENMGFLATDDLRVLVACITGKPMPEDAFPTYPFEKLWGLPEKERFSAFPVG